MQVEAPTSEGPAWLGRWLRWQTAVQARGPEFGLPVRHKNLGVVERPEVPEVRELRQENLWGFLSTSPERV